MSHRLHQPIGSVPGPALLCGLAGTAVGVALAFLGFFKDMDGMVKGFYTDNKFALAEITEVSQYVNWGIAGVVALLLAFMLLDSAFFWRRLLLGIGALALVIGASVTLMFWSIYFSPVVTLAAVAWTWLCAVIYAGQHHMPCELEPSTEVVPAMPQAVTLKDVVAKVDEDLVPDVGVDPNDDVEELVIRDTSTSALEVATVPLVPTEEIIQEAEVLAKDEEMMVSESEATVESADSAESTEEVDSGTVEENEPAPEKSSGGIPMPKVRKKKKVSDEDKRFMPSDSK